MSRLNRTLAFITGTLAFVLVAYFIFQRPRHPSAPFTKSVDPAEKIVLQTGSAKIELVRDDKTWIVNGPPGAGQFKADPDKIKSLLDSLRNIALEDVISTRPDHASEFEVNPESATRVSLYTKSGSLLAEGIVGKQAPDFTHLYFKYPSQPYVYLARGAIRGDLGQPDLNFWRDRALLNIAEDQVTALAVDTSEYKTHLTRSSDTWSCNGRTVDPAPVWGLLGVVVHLRADGFVDTSQRPELTAEKLKYATVTLQARDGAVHKLHVGRLDPNPRGDLGPLYPVALNNGPSVAWVTEKSLKIILCKPSDFKPKT